MTTPRSSSSLMRPSIAEPFVTLEQQAHAVRVGMWAFLASEVLLFAGLFALIAGQAIHFPHGYEFMRLSRASNTIRIAALGCLGFVFLLLGFVSLDVATR